jgi:hypothetical protein
MKNTDEKFTGLIWDRLRNKNNAYPLIESPSESNLLPGRIANIAKARIIAIEINPSLIIPTFSNFSFSAFGKFKTKRLSPTRWRISET